MRWLLDLAYLVAAVVTLPIWLTRMIITGKVRTDWRARFGRVHREQVERLQRLPVDPRRPYILIHAVSVGEVNAAAELIEQLKQHAPDAEIIVASTTDTGFRRAAEIYGDRHVVVRYPFDLSWSVSRFLDALRPDAVVLIELEVWPNFTAACMRRHVPVCVVNGRLSRRSLRRYSWIGGLIRPVFRRLAFVAAQTETYAQRFTALGATRIVVTNTMKWDTARITDSVAGADELGASMGIDRTRPLVVAGSTTPEEHTLLDRAVGDDAQLLCAPRKPEWFERAAVDLPGCVRRSRGERDSASDRFLLDTIGELRLAYALADVVVVGRTFAPYGGSDMMEPIALGRATIIGPDVRNFAEMAEVLLKHDGLIQTDEAHLREVILRLLASAAERQRIACNGRAVIRENQGASRRNAELVLELLDRRISTADR